VKGDLVVWPLAAGTHWAPSSDVVMMLVAYVHDVGVEAAARQDELPTKAVPEPALLMVAAPILPAAVV
jgi:hypothetical protein